MYLPRNLYLSRIVKSTSNVNFGDWKLFAILSSDTEFDPPSRNATWKRRRTDGLLDGLPRLLELCDEHEAPATLFCEGKLVEEFPEMMNELGKKHEIGCHSYAHEWLGTTLPPWWIPCREEFTVLTFNEKQSILSRAAKAIEQHVGRKVRSFKAPFNSVDHPSTLRVLEQTGFDSDSSLPCYDNRSFTHPLLPTPVRHTSANDLWRAGDMRLVEVPFMIRPRPLLFHPFDIREEVVDTIPRGMALALESVDVQCRIDHLSGRAFSMIHITSHPWEFARVRPWGEKGEENAKNLRSYLANLSGLYDVEFVTVSDFKDLWEKQQCKHHPKGERARSGEG